MKPSRNPEPTTQKASGSATGNANFRTKVIGLRLTPGELTEVETAMGRAGKTLPEWLRETVLKAARQGSGDISELLLEEVTALRYIVLNIFDATVQAAEQNKKLEPRSIMSIRDAADRFDPELRNAISQSQRQR